MKRIIVSVTNDLVTDQRVYKVCNTLFNAGFDILLIGRKLPNSKTLKRPYATYRFKLLFNKGALFYAEYNIRLFFKLLFVKKDILLANDLDTLLPNYLVSKLFNKKNVYDSHELFSQLPSLEGNYSKIIWTNLEKWLAPKQKYFITVSDSISKWYQDKYLVNPIVIKNLPTYKNIEFQESENKYLIYQGALNKGRGLLVLIEAMKFIENITLKIAGDGPFKTEIVKKIEDLNLHNKVELLGNINPDELLFITQKATAGISLEEDCGLSYRYSLPNKLFDYIQAKTPVIASYLPEIKLIVDHYKIGETISVHTPINIAATIIKVVKNSKEFYKENLENAAKELIWEKQEESLINLYRNV